MNIWDLKPSNKNHLCSISKYLITGKVVLSFIIVFNISGEK